MRSPPTAGRFAWTRPATFAALCLAAVLTTIPEPTGAEPPRRLAGNVEKVLDGDTLVVTGERVRLWGIDAPETRQACEGRDGVVYLCGQMAAKAMRELARARAVDCERSEEHTSELQSLMRNSYAVFCLKKRKSKQYITLESHN